MKIDPNEYAVTFIADLHVDNFARWGGPLRGGINDRGRAVLAAITEAVAASANSTREPVLVILGDIFNRSAPEPALIAAVQSVLAQHPRVYVLVGNHDQESSDFGHNACAPLDAVDSVTVVEDPIAVTPYGPEHFELLLVPFRPGPIMEWLPRLLDTGANFPPEGPRALCLHAGISDSATPYYLDDTSGSIAVDALARLCAKHRISHVFAGDWHRHQRWRKVVDGHRVTIMQVGALAPNRFPPNYEHGDKGPCAVWLPASGKVEVVDIPGPRFYKHRWSSLDKEWTPNTNAVPAFVKLTARSDQADEAKEWLEALRVRAALLDNGQPSLAGTELEIDRGAERAKARTASFEARQASSIDEAVARYVKAMPLEEGVDRDAVLDHVRRLMT